MTVLEDLRSLEQRLSARIRELQPLVEEYEELQRIAERLGVDLERETAAARPTGTRRASARTGRRTARAKTGKQPAKRAAKPRASASRSGRERPGGTQETGRERREKVLGLIKERPGITVPDIANETGVDAPSLYRVVRRLQQEGTITKEGKTLKPA